MNGFERTRCFVLGEETDRPPFMPLAIEWVARQRGIPYPDFVYQPRLRAEAYLTCAREFGFDCILPDADFFEQLEDFGAKPVWELNGFRADPILASPADAGRLPLPQMQPGSRMGNRLETLRLIAAQEKGSRYLFGICIGPFTEYCNARSMEEAFYDMADEPEAMLEAVEIFWQNGLRFIDAQLDAGADGVQIVEPSCSLVSPSFYRDHLMPLHTAMVERIQKKDGFARLHICGDTNRLLPYTLGTGAHILDVDSAVSLPEAAKLLGPGQVLCGNLDSASDVLQGTPESFGKRVRETCESAQGRIIIAAGCDVPPGTPAENMRAFYQACEALGNR